MTPADRVLAFRLARLGLAERVRGEPAAGAACPASDFARDAALTAVAARVEGVDREGWDRAVDAGDVVVAYSVRGAIHAVAGADHALWGRALVARDDDELGAQMGRQVQRLARERGFSPADALAQVADAVTAALRGGAALDRGALHEELRRRLPEELLPWCRGCASHHVAPMMWRYATVRAGARLDAERRYVAGAPGRPPAAAEAVRRYLSYYGPSTAGEFAEWAGVARPHADRLWGRVAGELAEVRVGGSAAWIAEADLPALEDPPAAEGLRLLPPGDPALQKPNRPHLVPDPSVAKRLFRPIGSPGAILAGGRLAGLWTMTRRGARAEVTVEALRRLRRVDLTREAERIARLRGARDVAVSVG